MPSELLRQFSASIMIIVRRGTDLQFETGEHGLGDILAQVIFDVDAVNTAAAAAFDAGGGGNEAGAFARIQKAETDLLGHGGTVGVHGGDGEGEVRQRKDGAAHDAAFRVLVASGEVYGADGAVLGEGFQGEAVVGGEMIIPEALIVRITIKGISSRMAMMIFFISGRSSRIAYPNRS